MYCVQSNGMPVSISCCSVWSVFFLGVSCVRKAMHFWYVLYLRFRTGLVVLPARRRGYVDSRWSDESRVVFCRSCLRPC